MCPQTNMDALIFDETKDASLKQCNQETLFLMDITMLFMCWDYVFQSSIKLKMSTFLEKMMFMFSFQQEKDEKQVDLSTNIRVFICI